MIFGQWTLGSIRSVQWHSSPFLLFCSPVCLIPYFFRFAWVTGLEHFSAWAVSGFSLQSCQKQKRCLFFGEFVVVVMLLLVLSLRINESNFEYELISSGIDGGQLCVSFLFLFFVSLKTT